MITIEMTKLNAKDGKPALWQLVARDTATAKVVATGGGETPRIAAKWLVHKVNRLLADVENHLVEMDLITEREIDEISDAVTEQLIAKDSDQ